MRKYIFLSFLYICICTYPLLSYDQTIDTVATYSIAAYADVYYATYTDSVGTGNFQKFPTVSPRNNSIGLNDFQIASRYDGEKVRAMATLQVGDIALSTWSRTYNFIQEAHVGFRVCKTLWVDAGFFRTHFGTEYLLPIENITSSVAVATYYEPYYEAGVRLNYDPTKNLEINLFLLNGYGVFEDNNKRKSFGAGITYALNDNAGIGYTNYIGNDAPDSITLSQLRVAQNVFFNYSRRKIKVQAGADLYIQQHASLTNSSNAATMYSGMLTVAYKPEPKFEIYVRGETFHDPDGFVSAIIGDASGNLEGYKLWGVTAGLEYKPTNNSYIRLEGRRLQMDNGEEIFHYGGKNVNYNYGVMINAGLSFTLLKGVQTK